MSLVKVNSNMLNSTSGYSGASGYSGYSGTSSNFINAQKFTKPPEKIYHDDLTVIHAFGNNFTYTNPNHWGKKNIGFINTIAFKSNYHYDEYILGLGINQDALNGHYCVIPNGINQYHFDNANNTNFTRKKNCT